MFAFYTIKFNIKFCSILLTNINKFIQTFMSVCLVLKYKVLLHIAADPHI